MTRGGLRYWPLLCARCGRGVSGWVFWFRVCGYGLWFKAIDNFWRRRYTVRRWFQIKVLTP